MKGPLICLLCVGSIGAMDFGPALGSLFQHFNKKVPAAQSSKKKKTTNKIPDENRVDSNDPDTYTEFDESHSDQEE